MARKTFVSTKKNAPTQAVSSKEAALRSRQVADDAHAKPTRERERVSAASPASSLDSSYASSSDDDDALLDGDDEIADADVVAVEVLPASVGRGKQLRFPQAISRGKESRILHSGSEYGSSDSDSGADESEGEEGDVDPSRELQQEQPQDGEQDEDPIQDASNDNKDKDDALIPVAYPIKAARARKRHRPESDHFAEYFRQMATHVRDCLLSVREGADADAADVFREEVHREFRRKLDGGTVPRVEWKEEAPEEPMEIDQGEEQEQENNREKEKEKSRSSANSNSNSNSDEKQKKEERSKESDGKKERTKDESKKERGREKEKERSSGKHRHKSTSSKERKGVASESSSKSSRRSGSEKHRSERTHSSHRHSGSSSEKKSEDIKRTTDTTTKEVKEEINAMEIVSNAVVVTKNSLSNGTHASDHHDNQDSEHLCASCKRKRDRAVDAEAQTDALPKPTPQPAPVPEPSIPLGEFLIPRGATGDVNTLRVQAGKLNDDARRLKHEGDRKGNGTVEQGKDYIRSSLTFFQHALMLSDIKAVYKDHNDAHHARSYGDASIETLRSTSSLVETTIRNFQNANNTRLLALAQKMAAIVHLTIYRLQHLKLSSLYAELSPAGRSPDSRPNGTTPPIIPNGSESQEAAIRAHLVKEMRHMLRGFEMWRRYETTQVHVLPRVTNPVIVDLNVFFEDLQAEISSW